MARRRHEREQAQKRCFEGALRLRLLVLAIAQQRFASAELVVGVGKADVTGEKFQECTIESVPACSRRHSLPMMPCLGMRTHDATAVAPAD